MGRSAWTRRWLRPFCLFLGFRAAAADGAIDLTFQAPFLGPIPNLIVVQADGRSLVSFGSAGGVVGLARLDTNGILNAGFSTAKGPLILTPPISFGGLVL